MCAYSISATLCRFKIIKKKIRSGHIHCPLVAGCSIDTGPTSPPPRCFESCPHASCLFSCSHIPLGVWSCPLLEFIRLSFSQQTSQQVSTPQTRTLGGGGHTNWTDMCPTRDDDVKHAASLQSALDFIRKVCSIFLLDLVNLDLVILLASLQQLSLPGRLENQTTYWHFFLYSAYTESVSHTCWLSHKH